ncbi:hypothetical protein [Nocardia bovistercoris]|uniref:Hemophore-related protein n=1 Tax=Nocardia bovistercoris TaxID=2785916 RepID=A0A931IAP8_9NOCA|nr:hypothetical protein [Nocardia bovistercoris]MBH0776985.1 hypothetical protein [Nocardia bovistercoris]
MKIRPTVIAASFAMATAIGAGWTTAAAAPAAYVDLPASDCAILSQIGPATVGTLGPLQALPPDQAAAGMAAYIAKLRAQQSQVSSPEAQADIEALITALQGATGPESAGAVYGALGNLNTACS